MRRTKNSWVEENLCEWKQNINKLRNDYVQVFPGNYSDHIYIYIYMLYLFSLTFKRISLKIMKPKLKVLSLLNIFIGFLK